MARRKGRIKDKWREKRWVNVNAPDSFNNVPIAYVPITDDENAKGRILEVTLWDILKGDPSQHQYKIIFQIDEVNDTKAKTVFKRYEYSKEFLRSLIRRGSSKVNFNIDIQTKDNYIFRIKMIALTHRQLNTSRQRQLRLIAKDVIEKVIKELANYTVYHFGYEEKYFDQFGYSETVAHKKEHKDFVDTVSKFQSEFASGNALLSMEVMSFLKKWLQGHIKGTDQHYTEFFHEHGMN